MTTTNTEQLTLYKHPKLYNGSRYKFYHDSRNYDTWLDLQSSGKYTTTVYYKSISEPILLDKTISDIDTYTYGSITNGNNTSSRIYYFFVDSISTDEHGRTTLTYTVDWWATLWSNIICTKAHISRQNITKPGYMEQPVSNFKMDVSQVPFTTDFVFMATYIPSNENISSFITYIVLEGNLHNASIVGFGNWYQILQIPGADIKDCFVVPIYTYDGIGGGFGNFWVVNTTEYTSGSTASKIESAIRDNFGVFPPVANFVGQYIYDVATSKYYESYEVITDSYNYNVVNYEDIDAPVLAEYYCHGYLDTDTGYTHITDKYKMYRYIKDEDYVPVVSQSMFSVTFSSNELERQGIADWNGNLIWECPLGYSNITFETRLLLGISHAMIEFIPHPQYTNIGMLNGLSFCYDCRHPGLFVDSYQDYVLKNRDYDIQMRKIQSEKQEIQSWASTAENVGFGFAFGGGAGAAAAGVGGIIEAVSTTLINRMYDPKIQKQYDLRYARMTDQISLVGDSITNVYWCILNRQGLLMKYTLSVSSDCVTRYNNDIGTNGYYTDEITDDLSTYFNTGVVIQADNVVVEGACTLGAKQQVVERLSNGVEFI